MSFGGIVLVDSMSIALTYVRATDPKLAIKLGTLISAGIKILSGLISSISHKRAGKANKKSYDVISYRNIIRRMGLVNRLTTIIYESREKS
jgi:hypothetical protein